MKTQAKADLAMVIVVIFWGSSYVFMKMGLDSVEEFNLIGLRFSIAFLFAGIIFYKRLLKLDMTTLKYGMMLGFILFAVFSAITLGVKSTTASNAGFLVSLAVIFVPVLSSIFLKEKMNIRVLIGICVAILGIGLLTVNSQLNIKPGDAWCILGALLYATHIIITGSFTKKVDSLTLGILQLGFAGGFGFLFSIMMKETPQLPSTPTSWIAVLSLGIFCSAIGFTIQTVSQKYTSPTNTGIIFSLEPVVAVLFAFFLLGETLTLKGYLGATIVLAGVFISKVDINKLKPKRFRNSIS